MIDWGSPMFIAMKNGHIAVFECGDLFCQIATPKRENETFGKARVQYGFKGDNRVWDNEDEMMDAYLSKSKCIVCGAIGCTHEPVI